jgi:hypothetical protein
VATAIVTKYSTANTVPLPGQLLDGELAYSFPSGNLFIGANGTYETIGGKYYADIINRSTANSDPNTLVLRNAEGVFSANLIFATAKNTPGFVGNLQGIADQANSLADIITISIDGDATGSSNTSLNVSTQPTITVTLSNTTVTPGAYGNSTTIPVITVDEKGRVTNLQNVSIDIISQDAFEQANAAANLAQAAYDAANSSTPSFNQSSFEQANAAFEFANLLSTYANTPSSIANIALDLALDAFRYANAAFNVANSDNFTGTTANAAFDSSNSASVYANAAFTQANISFEFANSALILVAQSSNSIVGIQSIAANAEIVAFSAADRVNSAYLHANSSFDTANLKLNTSGGTITGNLLISGNLIVAGNVSYIATNHLNIGDNIITLNADLGQSATPTENSGIEVERGNQPNTSLLWNETTDKWSFTNDGTNYSDIGSSAAEVYANAAFQLSNTTLATSVQNQISVTTAFNKTNSSFNTVNSTIDLVNIGFDYLNVSLNAAFTQANTPSEIANLAFIQANAAFDAANSLSPEFNQASFARANDAYDAANSSSLYANAAFSLANSITSDSTDVFARIQANSAFDQANAAFANGNTNFVFANASFLQTNTATIIALAAYARANSIIDLASGQAAYDAANDAFIIGQSSYIHANAAFDVANTLASASIDFYARPHVNAAFTHANSSYDLANTKFASAGGTISGDVTINANLIIQGSSVTVSVPSLIIEDNIIDISAETVGTPTNPAGIRVIRGDEFPVQFRWDEVIDKWTFTNDGVSYSVVSSAAAEVYSNTAYSHANASYVSQNTTGVYANIGYGHANSAYVSQNTTGVYANTAFNHSNTRFAAAGGTISGDVVVSGNLTIVGETVYANTQTVLIKDNIITLNAAINQLAPPEFNAGFEVDRGSSPNVSLIWNEAVDNWQYTIDGSNFYNVASGAAESYSNAAFQSQNTTGVYANSAFASANVADQRAVTSGVYANTAYQLANNLITSSIDLYARPHVNAAFIHANSVYDLSNTTSQRTTSAESYANSGFIKANIASQEAVTSGSYANSAYTQANTSTTNAAAADLKALSAGSYANSGYTQANVATRDSVSSSSYANSGFNRANTAITNAAIADQKALSAGEYANVGFQVANTKFSSGGGEIVGDVLVTGNITVNGNTASFSVPHFIVQDGIIDLNVEEIGSNPSANAGIRTLRGDLNPTSIIWNEYSDSWTFSNDGLNFVNIASSSAESYANGAFQTSNSASSYSNSAFSIANTALTTGGTIVGGYANGAYAHANSAHALANTKFASAGGTISGDTSITGKFTVDGQASFHTPIVQLNSDIDQDASPSENAGIRVDRGISPNVSILWNEGNDHWSFTNDGSVFSPIGSAAAESYANSAYIHANSSFVSANSSGVYANVAFFSQNTTGVYANSAFASANVADQRAVTSGTYANAAYAEANTKLTSAGGTIDGNLVVTGNLTVTGNTVYHSANDFIVSDPIILLANTNPGNLLDIGFVAHYVEETITKHTGLVRDVSGDVWYLFDNYIPHLQETNILNVSDASFRVANLTANLITQVVFIRGYDPINHTNTSFEKANSAFNAANVALADSLAFSIALG